MAWGWPWGKRSRDGEAVTEQKQAEGWGFIGVYGQGEPNWIRNDYGSLSRDGFMRNPVAHRGVRMIAEAAASIPWLAYEGQAELEEHPLLDLLKRPNQRQAGPSFMESLYGHLIISGNAYVEMIEAPGGARELYLLRPDRVSIVTDGSGWPVALEHAAGSVKRRISLEEGGSGMQLTLFHPLDDHYGFAPLSAAMQALDIHNAAARWNKALLDNSARPSGALVYAPMPNVAADAAPIAFGDFKRGYLVVDRAGVRVLRDPYSAKPYVLFYTTKRVGGGIQDFEAIKLLKVAAS